MRRQIEQRRDGCRNRKETELKSKNRRRRRAYRRSAQKLAVLPCRHQAKFQAILGLLRGASGILAGKATRTQSCNIARRRGAESVATGLVERPYPQLRFESFISDAPRPRFTQSDELGRRSEAPCRGNCRHPSAGPLLFDRTGLRTDSAKRTIWFLGDLSVIYLFLIWDAEFNVRKC